MPKIRIPEADRQVEQEERQRKTLSQQALGLATLPEIEQTAAPPPSDDRRDHKHPQEDEQDRRTAERDAQAAQEPGPPRHNRQPDDPRHGIAAVSQTGERGPPQREG